MHIYGPLWARKWLNMRIKVNRVNPENLKLSNAGVLSNIRGALDSWGTIFGLGANIKNTAEQYIDGDID